MFCVYATATARVPVGFTFGTAKAAAEFCEMMFRAGRVEKVRK